LPNRITKYNKQQSNAIFYWEPSI